MNVEWQWLSAPRQDIVYQMISWTTVKLYLMHINYTQNSPRALLRNKTHHFM